jgi:hypothetical protein
VSKKGSEFWGRRSVAEKFLVLGQKICGGEVFSFGAEDIETTKCENKKILNALCSLCLEFIPTCRGG